jgi:hypothetical protein
MGLTTTVSMTAALALSLGAQLTNLTPSDARSNQFEDPRGTSWRVFAVDSDPQGPLAITEVQEVKQHNPPSTWGVIVRNRSLGPVASYTLAAAVVLVDGTVKGVQTLPAIKNLGPSQVRRQEARIVLTTINPTDRVVFYVNEVTRDAAAWKAAKAEVEPLIKAAAKRLPLP